MKKNFAFGVFLILIFFGCDNLSTSVHEETDFFSENALQSDSKISPHKLRWVKPGSKAFKNSESNYLCYVWQSGRNGIDDAKAHAWQVIFPNKITKSTGSETTRFIYKKFNINGNLVRYGGCIVPNSEKAIDLIKKAFDGDSTNSQKNDRKNNDHISGIMSDCDDYECDLVWDPSLQEYVCTAPPCEGGGDEENGDEPPPYGGGGNNPPGDGNGEDHDEELPEHLEPCQTNDPLLNNVPFQFDRECKINSV